MNADKKLFTMNVWPNGIAQFFPWSDYVLVQREKKRLFRPKEETGLVPYESVIETIGHLLEDHEFRGRRFKHLPPETKPKAGPYVEKLTLQPSDLTKHTQVAPDAFHDVEGISTQ